MSDGLRRIHYSTGQREVYCGRTDPPPRARSLQIPAVTCKSCLKRLWRDVSLAHFRAYGAGNTEFGRRIRGAMREAEVATRTSG